MEFWQKLLNKNDFMLFFIGLIITSSSVILLTGSRIVYYEEMVGNPQEKVIHGKDKLQDSHWDFSTTTTDKTHLIKECLGKGSTINIDFTVNGDPIYYSIYIPKNSPDEVSEDSFYSNYVVFLEGT